MAGEGDANRSDGDDRLRAMAEVMGDPVRGKIFFAVADASFSGGDEDRGSVGITVRQISARVEEPARRVRYHLEALVGEKFVAVSDRRKRRGVFERYYCATEVPIIRLESTVRRTVSTKGQRQLTLEILKAIFADARAALAAGTYNSRPEWVAARLRADVDEEGWRELSTIQEAAVAEAQQVLTRVRERAGDSSDRLPVVVASLLFEAAPWSA